MAEPYLGEIRIFGFNFAPRGWAQCDGQLLPIGQNTALFSLLGTTYGGDGETTFALPDLRGRVAGHEGTGPGLPPFRLGERLGAPNHTLSVPELPPHTHTARAQSGDGDSATPVGNVWSDDLGVSSATYSTAGANANMSSQAIGNTGSGQAFRLYQPTLVVNFCIAVTGLFPSRN